MKRASVALKLFVTGMVVWITLDAFRQGDVTLAWISGAMFGLVVASWLLEASSSSSGSHEA